MTATFATKRMWLRRWNRVGFFLLPVLKLPFYPFIWAFQFYRAWFRSWANTNSDMFVVGAIGQTVVAIILFVVMWNSHLGRDATVEEIMKARAADTCFDDTIVRRAAAWNRPITISDLKQTQHDCAEMWEEQARKKAQQEALRGQLEK